MVVQLCDYAKTHLNCVHVKWVNFTVCEVYLNKDIYTQEECFINQGCINRQHLYQDWEQI